MDITTSQAKAKQLRHHLTDPEQILWYHLRANRFYGHHFRRQYPIGNYIVDFCCVNKKLIIELDGDSHGDQVSYDLKRTSFLQLQGYVVLRYWNNEVMNNLDGILENLKTTIDKT